MVDPLDPGFPTPIVWIFVAAGALFAVFGVALLADVLISGRRRRAWAQTVAVLDRLELGGTGSSRGVRWMRAAYHYRDDRGVEHRGTGRIPVSVRFGTPDEQRALEILYDPARPERSMPVPQGRGVSAVVGVLLIAFGAAFAWIVLTVFGGVGADQDADLPDGPGVTIELPQ